MFNIIVDYPSYQDELTFVKNTTIDKEFDLKQVLSARK
jgi:hypothetical protein